MDGYKQRGTGDGLEKTAYIWWYTDTQQSVTQPVSFSLSDVVVNVFFHHGESDLRTVKLLLMGRNCSLQVWRRNFHVIHNRELCVKCHLSRHYLLFISFSFLKFKHTDMYFVCIAELLC